MPLRRGKAVAPVAHHVDEAGAREAARQEAEAEHVLGSLLDEHPAGMARLEHTDGAVEEVDDVTARGEQRAILVPLQAKVPPAEYILKNSPVSPGIENNPLSAARTLWTSDVPLRGAPTTNTVLEAFVVRGSLQAKLRGTWAGVRA